ncbi:transposase [Tamlana fucoidanivorans]
MKAKRQSTVEPVFGTLTQFMGLRKVNTIGIKQANKCMQLSAIAYNLKKYLKFIEKHSKSGAASLQTHFCMYKGIIGLVISPRKHLDFRW